MIIFDIFFCAAMFGQPPHSDNLSWVYRNKFIQVSTCIFLHYSDVKTLSTIMKTERVRASWTQEQDLCWITEMTHQVHSLLGRRAQSGFKREAWDAAVKNSTLNLSCHTTVIIWNPGPCR
jgi:hypothetical protein